MLCLTFHPHHERPPDACGLIRQGAMREEPIEKNHIACWTGDRGPWGVWQELWRDEDFPVLCLLVGIGGVIHARNHLQGAVGHGGVD